MLRFLCMHHMTILMEAYTSYDRRDWGHNALEGKMSRMSSVISGSTLSHSGQRHGEFFVCQQIKVFIVQRGNYDGFLTAVHPLLRY